MIPSAPVATTFGFTASIERRFFVVPVVYDDHEVPPLTVYITVPLSPQA